MRFALPAVFVLAIANGLYADISFALSAPIAQLPFSPVIAIIVVALTRLMTPAAPIREPFCIAAAALMTAGALLPSSLAAWLTMGAVSAVGIFWDRGRTAAYRMALALAFTQIWHGSVFKVFANSLTGIEALLLAACLRGLGFAPLVEGNVVRVTSEHALVLLSGCSVFSGLGVTLLGWSAVFCLMRAGERFSVKSIAAVALAAIALNLSRLIVMALGPQWHALAHDGAGAQVYDAAVCVLVISAAWFPARTPTAMPSRLPQSDRAPAAVAAGHWHLLARREAMACVALLALLAVSLPAKSVRYSAADPTGWQEAKARIKGAILKHGFEFSGSVAMTADGAIEGMMFKKANCSAPLVIGFMGASSDTLPLIASYMDGTPIALYIEEQPAGSWVVSRFLAANIAEIVTSLPLGRKPELRPLLAVSRPPENANRHCLWPQT